MKREIKFRGKDNTGKWHIGNLNILSENCAFVANEQVDVNTIGQYIGRKDRNGNEIYEGDILRCDYYPFTNKGAWNYLLIIDYDNDAGMFYGYCEKRKESNVHGVASGNSYRLEEIAFEHTEIVDNMFDYFNLDK